MRQDYLPLNAELIIEGTAPILAQAYIENNISGELDMKIAT